MRVNGAPIGIMEKFDFFKIVENLILNCILTCAELLIVSSIYVLWNNIRLKQLQIVNIYILCVFISISPLLSHNFLASQVATLLLQATNSMPTKLIATHMFLHKKNVSAVMFCNYFLIYTVHIDGSALSYYP